MYLGTLGGVPTDHELYFRPHLGLSRLAVLSWYVTSSYSYLHRSVDDWVGLLEGTFQCCEMSTPILFQLHSGEWDFPIIAFLRTPRKGNTGSIPTPGMAEPFHFYSSNSRP